MRDDGGLVRGGSDVGFEMGLYFGYVFESKIDKINIRKLRGIIGL